MTRILYILWLSFAAIFFLQGAVTGSLRKRRGVSADAVWPIPQWARLLWLLAACFGLAALLVFLRSFGQSKLG
jgi:protein-S-isoprenylcysteine O-methyltransferase Ste14